MAKSAATLDPNDSAGRMSQANLPSFQLTQTHGPYAELALKQIMPASGKVIASSLVCLPEIVNWQIAASVPELARAFGPALLTPVPPVTSGRS